MGFTLLWGCYLVLPGDHQTVPASELFALLLIVAMLSLHNSIAVVVDSMYVHKGVLGNCRTGILAPMWKRLWDLTRTKQICVTTRWDKSHVDEMPLYLDTLTNPISDFIENAHADVCADKRC